MKTISYDMKTYMRDINIYYCVNIVSEIVQSYNLRAVLIMCLAFISC